MTSSPNVRHLYLGQRGCILRADLRIAIVALSPDLRDRIRDILVRRSAAEQSAEIMTIDREQTGVQLALGREPDAGAGIAERLGDGSDHADLAAPILVAP